jgi:predicted GNAT family acetyltransferase
MTVEHHPERNRFIITLAPDAEAYISYERLADGTLDLQHTVVPRAWREHGIGTTLVQQTMDIARREGFRVIPTCPFIATWLDRNLEYSDLSAET